MILATGHLTRQTKCHRIMGNDARQMQETLPCHLKMMDLFQMVQMTHICVSPASHPTLAKRASMMVTANASLLRQ